MHKESPFLYRLFLPPSFFSYLQYTSISMARSHLRSGPYLSNFSHCCCMNNCGATATATLLSVYKEKINYSGTNPLSPITDTYRMPRPITLINNNLE